MQKSQVHVAIPLTAFIFIYINTSSTRRVFKYVRQKAQDVREAVCIMERLVITPIRYFYGKVYEVLFNF